MRISKSLSRALRLPALFILCAVPASAQPAYRVKDIDTATIPGDIYFSGGLGTLGSNLVFGASRSNAGDRLWRSDGTPAGTTAVSGAFAPWSLTKLGPALYYFTNQPELWRTDGTPGGTVLVKSFPPSPAGPAVIPVSTETLLFFPADDGVHGFQLWKSDGTPDGTVRVSDFERGAPGSAPFGLVAVSGGVRFFSTDAAGGPSLWRSDGTAAGTVQIKSLGAEGQSPYDLAARDDGILFFFSSDASGMYHLWRSDGTDAGTIPLGDFVADMGGVCPLSCPQFGPSDLTPLGGRLLFFADDGVHGRELWSSDGTVLGTGLVKDIYRGSQGSVEFGIVAVGAEIYFVASDGIHGGELWRSDGTGPGTALVKDIQPGAADSYIYWLTSFQGRLFFRADDGVHGFELWASDGSESGTVLVKDLLPGSEGGAPALLTPAEGVLYFITTGVRGEELWKTDGTEAGTMLVDDFPSTAGSFPSYLTDIGGRLLFSVRAGEDPSAGYQDLWASDGTEADTVRIASFTHFEPVTLDPAPTSAVMKGRLFFGADDGSHGIELWSSHGTAAGTTMVRDIAPESYPSGLTVVGDRLFFAASDPVYGFELWSSDGTEAGTALVRDIKPGPEGSTDGNGFAALGGLLIFAANDGVDGIELWLSDGTRAGTFLVRDINPGPGGSNIYQFVRSGQRLFFFAYDGSDTGLWVTDGTYLGTRKVTSLGGNGLTAAGNLVYFSGGQPTTLWRSDGTPAGTFALKTIAASNLTALGESLFFTADDGVHGVELWRSDGTVEGTVLFKDIQPGPAGSMTPWPLVPTIAAVDGFLLFAADDGEHGMEPWVSDGTEQGTRMLQDIAPGAASSAPSQFTKSGSFVYFTADDTVTGTELWAFPLEALRRTPLETIEPVSRDSATRAVTPRQ